MAYEKRKVILTVAQTGNCQGKDILAGGYDVIVTDGFTGNVCLKNIEGTVKTLFSFIKTALTSSAKAKVGAVLIKGSLAGLKQQLNPDVYGGAPLIGVKGACVIGHGNSNAEAIANGILMTARVAASGTDALIAAALNDAAEASDGSEAPSDSSHDGESAGER